MSVSPPPGGGSGLASIGETMWKESPRSVEGAARVVHVQVEVVVTGRPGDLDADAAGVEGPEVRRDVDREGEMIAHEIARVGGRALLRKRGLRGEVGRARPRDGRIRRRDRAAPRSRGRRGSGDR